jgi:hypothetical protein
VDGEVESEVEDEVKIKVEEDAEEEVEEVDGGWYGIQDPLTLIIIFWFERLGGGEGREVQGPCCLLLEVAELLVTITELEVEVGIVTTLLGVGTADSVLDFEDPANVAVLALIADTSLESMICVQ